LNVTFSNNTTYDGSGTLNYKWELGSGSITSTSTNPTMSYFNPGLYTVALQATESIYGVSARGARTNYISASWPTVIANFTFVTSSNTAPSVATFTNTINGSGTQYNGSGTLIYFWDLGSGSVTATTQIPNPTTYTAGGTYLVQLQVTESQFGIASSITKTFTIA